MATFEVEPYKRYRDATDYSALVMPDTAGHNGDRSSVIGWVGDARSGGLSEVTRVLNQVVSLARGYEQGIYTAEEVAEAVRFIGDALEKIPTAHHLGDKRAS